MSKTHLAWLAVASATVAMAGAGQDGDLAAKLRSAGKAFLAATGTADPGGVRGPLADVVAIAAATAARGGVPKGVAARLDAAQAGLRGGAGPGSDGDPVTKLGEAYAQLNGGRRFAVPADVRTFDQAREACGRQVDAGAAALESGRREDAVRSMIAFALLVTTPFDGH